MKIYSVRRILAACLLGLVLAGMSGGCMTRTVREDGRQVDEKTVWIWQSEFYSH